MKIERIKMPDGTMSNAVLVHRSECSFSDDFVRNYEEIYYVPNRLIIRKFTVEYIPNDEGSYDERTLKSMTGTLCDGASIPAYDLVLKNTGTDTDLHSACTKPSGKSYNLQDVKDFLKENFPWGIQCFRTRNTVDDSMETVYSKDGVTVDYCKGYEYIEIFGLSNEDWQEIDHMLLDWYFDELV